MTTKLPKYIAGLLLVIDILRLATGAHRKISKGSFMVFELDRRQTSTRDVEGRGRITRRFDVGGIIKTNLAPRSHKVQHH